MFLPTVTAPRAWISRLHASQTNLYEHSAALDNATAFLTSLIIVLERVDDRPPADEDTDGLGFRHRRRFSLGEPDRHELQPRVLIERRYHRLGYFARRYHVRRVGYEVGRRHDDVTVRRGLQQTREKSQARMLVVRATERERANAVPCWTIELHDVHYLNQLKLSPFNRNATMLASHVAWLLQL